jgi:hypothetical protein
MRDRLSALVDRVRGFIKAWTQPHRRAASLALLKAAALLGALSEVGWLLNNHYFLKRFPQLPISLAWSMLTVIFLVTTTQIACSLIFKIRSARANRLSAEAALKMTELLTRHISGHKCDDEIQDAAIASPEDFERCVAVALLRLRGSALYRVSQLPEVIGLRDSWIARLKKGDSEERREAAEHLGLLHDPVVIPALEAALEDSVPTVVAAAVRGLLQLRFYKKRDELVRSLPLRSYVVRVLTACESADHASRLALEHPANAGLLELAQARGRAVGKGDLRPLLDDRDLRTRRSAMRLVPLAAPSASPARGAVMAALKHKELELRAEAAEVAGRLRLSREIGAVAECARESEDLDTTRAGCLALATLGASGRDSLRRMSAAGEAGDAPAEALGASLVAGVRGGRT